jgi:transposase
MACIDLPAYGWLAIYRGGGWARLDAKKRGGRRRLIDGKMMEWIYKTVTAGDPRQFKFNFALWTSKLIGEEIYRQFGIKLSMASVCRLLSQLGLSAQQQRPLWRAYQRDPEVVDKW